MTTSFYEFAIWKAKNYMKGLNPEEFYKKEHIDAFQIADILSIIFDKKPEEIVIDIAK